MKFLSATSQDFAEQAREQRLLAQANDADSEPLRQVKLDQSQAFESAVNDLIDSLGVPGEAGSSMKDVLLGRRKMLVSRKNELYRQFAEAAPEVRDVPIAADSVREAMLPADVLDDLANVAGESVVEGFERLLVKYGVNTDADDVERYTKGTTRGRQNRITPLTVGNFESFRQALNAFMGNGQDPSSRAMRRAVGPIIEALDNETRIVDGALREAGVDVDAIPALVEARQTVRQLRTEFSPQSVVGKLVGVKADGVTPTIEASRAAQAVLREPIENMRRVMASLESEGKRGEQVISNLQSKVVLGALERSLRGASRKISGLPVVNGNQFHKELDKLGADRLDLLFASNGEARKRLEALRGVAIDMTPSSAAVPKGSAGVNLDLFKQIGRLPGLTTEVINFALNKASKGREVRQALDADPKLKSKVEDFRQNWPTIALVLGIGSARDEEE